MAKEHLIDWDKYVVYDDGNIYSKHKGDLIKNTLDEEGYIRNGYRLKDGNSINCMRNRVIYAYFNGEIPDNMEVDHIDTNRANNAINNLRLLTHKDNCNNKQTLDNKSKAMKGRIISDKAKEKMRKSHSKPVNQYDLQGNFIKRWESAMEVQRELGYRQTHISACCLNKPYYKSYKGYIWKYADKE